MTKTELFLFMADGWRDIKPDTREEKAAKTLVSKLLRVDAVIDTLSIYQQEERDRGEMGRVCALNVAIESIKTALKSLPQDKV